MMPMIIIIFCEKILAESLKIVGKNSFFYAFQQFFYFLYLAVDY